MVDDDVRSMDMSSRSLQLAHIGVCKAAKKVSYVYDVVVPEYHRAAGMVIWAFSVGVCVWRTNTISYPFSRASVLGGFMYDSECCCGDQIVTYV